MKIGIAEQDELLADLISFRLELLGHEVVVWEMATEMLSAVTESRLDLLIVDTCQADMNGCETIQKVRQMHAADVLPILALSIDTDLSLVEQAYLAGANEYLITPFDPATLQEKADSLLLKKHCLSR